MELERSIHSHSLALIINGILLTLFAGWGCEVAMISGRKKAILYLIGLVIMYGFSLFTYFRANRIGDSIQDNLNQYWGTFSTTTRSMIQDFVRNGAVRVNILYIAFLGLLLWFEWSN